ncbi:luc7-like protein 3 [Helianthus annuus]|uniref:luc7-like protein 3 n=1 Tax=Helianthus annuus TaxID=4232 RepID=UPI001652B7FB|nr:luc7-like protein 3 [Helianthus annuus]
MAGSDEVNSRPVENHENAKIHVTGAELQALVDNAVAKAMERQYSDYSGTRSRTLSTTPSKPKTHSEAHSKPPPTPPKSKKEEPKKDDDRHSSNENSIPSKRILDRDPLRTADAEKRKREDDGSRHSDKKCKGNNDHKKGSGSKKGDQQTGDKPKCKVCKKHHFGRCRHESKSQSQPKACGIFKSLDHKALDCKKIKDATCYNCNEKGYLRTNCPKLAKKADEGKKTNARYG